MFALPFTLLCLLLIHFTHPHSLLSVPSTPSFSVVFKLSSFIPTSFSLLRCLHIVFTYHLILRLIIVLITHPLTLFGVFCLSFQTFNQCPPFSLFPSFSSLRFLVIRPLNPFFLILFNHPLSLLYFVYFIRFTHRFTLTFLLSSPHSPLSILYLLHSLHSSPHPHLSSILDSLSSVFVHSLYNPFSIFSFLFYLFTHHPPLFIVLL